MSYLDAAPLRLDDTAVDRRAPEKPRKEFPPVAPGGSWWSRLGITLGLLCLSVLLLTLAYAPVGQFYLAWFGLAPWLLVVHRSRTIVRAFFWSWLAGFLFFTANMWWMYAISVPGMFALMAYCGIYFGFAAVAIGSAKLLDGNALLALPAVAAIWCALEFIRGKLFTGLPWLFIGHTQSPFLAMCQIADSLGVYGITFWVVMLNTLVALLLIRRPRPPRRSVIPAGALVTATLLATFTYGVWRMHQPMLSPGPTILVVQENVHQDNSTGEKGATDEDLLAYHVKATQDALGRIGPGKVNLTAWAETTVAAPINRESVAELTETWPCKLGELILTSIAELRRLAIENHIGLLVGGRYDANWIITHHDNGTYPIAADARNTAYLFQPDGSFGDRVGERYDKNHLVPFGEYIPLRNTFLYKIFLALGPNYYDEYQLQDGSDNGLTVFKLRDATNTPRWRFVTPICFEDIDSGMCAAMLRPDSDGQKRADFIVNITNDGWFAANQNSQHFQAAIFRCIENRVPMARSVNQGVSGFIDSLGRTSGMLAARTAGTSVMQTQLDSRLTFYTRHGDCFAWLCVVLSAITIAGRIARSRIKPGASIQ